MKLYKLTAENNKTQNDTIWGPNISHELSSEGEKLCTEDVIHAYKHPLLAALFKPLHCPEYTKFWECEGEVAVDDGTKVGVKKLTTLKEVELPEITLEQRVKITILCVKKVFKDEKWNNWADKWLSGEDRSIINADMVYHFYNSFVIKNCILSVNPVNFAATKTVYVAIISTISSPYTSIGDIKKLAVVECIKAVETIVDKSFDTLSVIETVVN